MSSTPKSSRFQTIGRRRERLGDERHGLKLERPLSLLTPAQVVQLTGRKKKSLQVAWLTVHHVPHYVNAAGYPQVFSDMVPTARLDEFELGEVG